MEKFFEHIDGEQHEEGNKRRVIFPIPGVEPGPPGWKPGILTARPYGRSHTTNEKFII